MSSESFWVTLYWHPTRLLTNYFLVNSTGVTRGCTKDINIKAFICYFYGMLHLMHGCAMPRFESKSKGCWFDFYPALTHDCSEGNEYEYALLISWENESWVVPSDVAPFHDKSLEKLCHIIVRRAGLLLSQQDFEWRWSVPLFQCLTVLEFYFILFDLCLLITFFNFIMNYVPIVTFWIFTYHKIWILSIMFCFIWSYWIIYFLACL